MEKIEPVPHCLIQKYVMAKEEVKRLRDRLQTEFKVDVNKLDKKLEGEKPYLYPPPRVLVAPGKTVPITSLSEEEQAQYEAQILFVSEVAKIEFYEDDEWMVGS